MANILRVSYDSKDEWPIRSVTVYEDRAQITRILEYKATDFGDVELKLDNLPDVVIEDSVRAEIETDNAMIYEVSHNLKEAEVEIAAVTEQQTRISKELTELGQERGRVRERLDWLNEYGGKFVPSDLDIKDKGSKVIGALIDDQNLKNFSDALDMHQEETLKLQSQIIDIDARTTALNKELTDTYNKFEKEVESDEKTTAELSVLLNIPESVVEKDGLVIVKLFYVVNKASWAANYDVRVQKGADGANEVSITYYGKVINNSGEEWNEVELSLSTAKPSRPGNLPDLPRAIVRVAGYAARNDNYNDLQDQVEQLQLNEQAFDDDDENADVAFQAELDAFVAAETSDAAEKGGSAVFTLNRLVSIESDNKPHRQTIGSTELAPSFTYVVSPKVSASCFLKCSAKNNSKYIFVPGPMAVFFNGSFVTTSEMKLVTQNQVFSVYLGIEESVTVDYQPEISKIEKKKGGFITATHNLQTVSRTIIIKNTRKETINCVLYEQVPLARHNTIKVEVLSPNVEKKKGKKSYKITKLGNHLEGKNEIEAGKSWKLKFEFKVEWPKDKEIVYLDTMDNGEEGQ